MLKNKTSTVALKYQSACSSILKYVFHLLVSVKDFLNYLLLTKFV